MSVFNKKFLVQDFQLYKRLFANYVRPHWGIFLISILGSMAFSGIDAGVAYLFKPLLDKGFVQKELWFVRWAPLLILLAFTLRSVAHFTANYATLWVARSIIMDFRQQIFKHFLKLPAHFYDHHSSGHLLSKLLYDVEQIAKISTDAITDLVQSLCLIVGLITVMFIISWKLSLLYLITAPVIAWLIRFCSLRIRRVSRNLQKTMSEVTEIAEESISGYRVIRLFGGQAYENAKFVKATRESRNRDLKVEVTKCISVSGVQLIAALAISGVVYLAISPASNLWLSAGGFVSMLVSMLALLRPMKTLTTVNVVIQRGLAGSQSIFDLLDTPTEKNMGTVALTSVRGAIVYEQISFRYPNSDKNALQDISFKAEVGQTLAFVGKSGSGKSTLVSLLPRFYEYQEGRILLDGIEIQSFSLKNLRKHIALVSQNVTLFNDTVANNIAYGALRQASETEIIRAAEAAHAMEFIAQLPEGLNTRVGENGVLLSGGQRQRIAIARAMLKNAPVLILDEATSALDTESERKIQMALEELMHARTTLVIAHRLSTIEKADKIFVMEQGQIVECGTHQELIAQEGAYAKFHALQFKEKNVD